MGIPGNLDRFSGFADIYDAYRPAPPAALTDLLTQLAGAERPALVVDIGSGTGLSTVIWAERAEQVVGIEPNADMRQQAELRRPQAGTVTYRDGLSSDTRLPDACADIVTCSQSLHWLEPESTFAEVARILRPGGTFAAYDCDWPPTMHWEAEAAYDAFMARGTQIERERGIDLGIQRWEKSGHLERIRRSGRFRYVRETLLHHVEPGNAERLVGLAMSQGGIAGLLRRGVSEQEIGLDVLRAESERVLGSKPRPWFWSYRVRIGIV